MSKVELNAWDNIGNELVTGGRKERASFVKLVDGNNILRILTEPYTRYTHWIPSANLSIDCPGKGCPVCKINDELKVQGLDKAYSNQKKFLMYVHNRVSGKIELWDIGKTVMSSVFNEMNDRRDEGKSFNPTSFDLKIRKASTGTTIKSVDNTADDSIIAQLDNMTDIKEVSIKLDNDKVTELLNGKTLKEIFEVAETATDEVVILG